MAHGMYQESFEIPHEKVDPSVYEILEDGIRAAWDLLETYPPAGFVMSDETKEVPINFRLHETLVDRVWNQDVVEGFDENIFRNIERGPEVCDYNSTRLEKRPDMLARLTGRPQTVKPTQDGIFVECKPIDTARPLTTAYCKEGIRRFIDGRYAWAMRDALMIGYPLEESDVIADLAAAFKKQATIVAFTNSPSGSLPFGQTVSTEHRRIFTYVQSGKGAPPIVIRHLWLNRN